MIAKIEKMVKRKNKERTSVLVYTSPSLAESKEDLTNYVVETLRSHPSYKVIETYGEKTRLAVYFDVVLCRLDSPSNGDYNRREKFLRDLTRKLRLANTPLHVNPSGLDEIGLDIRRID